MNQRENKLLKYEFLYSGAMHPVTATFCVLFLIFLIYNISELVLGNPKTISKSTPSSWAQPGRNIKLIFKEKIISTSIF